MSTSIYKRNMSIVTSLVVQWLILHLPMQGELRSQWFIRSEYPRWTVLIVNVFYNVSSLQMIFYLFSSLKGFIFQTFLWFEELNKYGCRINCSRVVFFSPRPRYCSSPTSQLILAQTGVIQPFVPITFLLLWHESRSWPALCPLGQS